MKKFNFEYSALTYTLLALVSVLTAVGCGWNIYNIISFSYAGALKITLYSIIVAICFAVTVVALSIIIYGKYLIFTDKLVCRVGFFKTSISLKNIQKITHFRKSNKLVLYYKDKYSVVVINPKFYEDFILTIRENNSQIEYDVQTDGEDIPRQ